MNGFHAGAFFWLSFVLRKVLFYCRLEAIGFGHLSLLFRQKSSIVYIRLGSKYASGK